MRCFTYSRHAVDDSELVSEGIIIPPAARRIGTENSSSVVPATSKWRVASERVRHSTAFSTRSTTAHEGASTSSITVNVIPEEIVNDQED